MNARALILAVMLCARYAIAGAIELGERVEMFVDEHLIERKQNVELRLNSPVKREVVLVADKPWEGPTSAYYTVFQDAEKILLYYRGSAGNKGEDEVTCYAESTDGVHFTRPELGLVEFNGSKANNILFREKYAASFAPFKDANPKAKPDEKYKALCYEVRDRSGTMTALASPDGIHWRRMMEGSVVPKGSYDSLNTVSWDASIKKYRCFNRYWDAGNFKGVRAIESRTSEDFITWSEPTHHVYPADAPREHFYTSSTIRCPGAEQFWLAFPMRLMPDRKKVASHKEPAVSDAVFMSSRDGVNWDRAFREAWILPGPDEKNWTDRNTMPAWGIVQTTPDEFSMYVSEHYRWPDNRLRRVTVRRHGFASIHAGPAGGEFISKPLVFNGQKLIVNYATSAAGSLAVEIQDESGSPIPGFALADMQPIYGDELDKELNWKSESSASLAGKTVKLRFVLSDCDVYGLCVRGQN